MSKIRKAHSVMLFERRLDAVERAGEVDALELIGLHDELARIERKWLMQIGEGSERRQPGDPGRLDGWFDRLGRQIDRALRTLLPNDPAQAALRRSQAALGEREKANREAAKDAKADTKNRGE